MDSPRPVDDKPRVVGLTPTQKTWRILIADDNRENLLLLKSLLEEVGFVVMEAENGKEAVAVFKKESPDLIWMDMRMPVMDGYEATRRIRKWELGSRNAEGGSGKGEGAREEGEKLGRWEGEKGNSEVGMLPTESENRNKNRKDSDSNSAFRIPHSAFKGVPIIAITASAFGDQLADILAAGCNDSVIKPFQTHKIFEVMGRFLDIEYIYEQEGETVPSRMAGTDLTAEMLADLPADLLQELRETIPALNREAISAVIERIEPLAPDTANGLREMLDKFQMTKLMNLLGEVKG